MTDRTSNPKTVRWLTATPEWVLNIDCDGPNCEVVPAKAYDRLHASHAELERTIAILRGAVAKATDKVREGLPHELRGAIKELLTERSSPETKAPQWQPIGNEPRDTTILCYWPAVSEYGVPTTCTAVHSSIGDGWHRPHSTFSELRTPTHWMSIPASPVKSNEQPSAPASPPLSKSASSTDEAGAGLTVSKPAQHIPGALRCEKHGVTFAFDGDTCWACQEESNAPINS